MERKGNMKDGTIPLQAQKTDGKLQKNCMRCKTIFKQEIVTVTFLNKTTKKNIRFE